jgi:hypothetical protein
LHREEVGEPLVYIRSVVRREARAPEGGIVPAALAGQGQGGSKPVEDDAIPVLPKVPEAEETQRRGDVWMGSSG